VRGISTNSLPRSFSRAVSLAASCSTRSRRLVATQKERRASWCATYSMLSPTWCVLACPSRRVCLRIGLLTM